MIIVGICGPSCSGKTTLAYLIKKKLNKIKCEIISLDNYYKDRKGIEKKKRNHINFDHPSAFDFDLLLKHLEMLKKGFSINVPIYNFKLHTRDKRVNIIRAPDVLILEGILLFYNKKVLKYLDLKLFLNSPPDIRLIRRIKRDIKERGRNLSSILEQYIKYVRPMNERYEDKQNKLADIVVDGLNFNDSIINIIIKKVINLLAKYN